MVVFLSSWASASEDTVVVSGSGAGVVVVVCLDPLKLGRLRRLTRGLVVCGVGVVVVAGVVVSTWLREPNLLI